MVYTWLLRGRVVVAGGGQGSGGSRRYGERRRQGNGSCSATVHTGSGPCLQPADPGLQVPGIVPSRLSGGHWAYGATHLVPGTKGGLPGAGTPPPPLTATASTAITDRPDIYHSLQTPAPN